MMKQGADTLKQCRFSRNDMNKKDIKHVRTWYWSGAVLVMLILVVGGITRLTDSGLSMVDWNPIMGAIPPLTESAWEDTFESYKQFPEYSERNAGMSLSEFKYIFFWEYLHRMLGRLAGLVFLVPFGWFLIKKKMDQRQIKRALILLLLGSVQGLMGWYMVQSGLVDVPYVSHYRLAAHLLLAMAIFGACVLFALDLNRRPTQDGTNLYPLKKWGWIFMSLLILQITWGAFVAGLNAGHVYNTFPKMFGYWLPPELWVIQPVWLNLFENPATTQFIHRVAGTVLGIMAVAIWIGALMKNYSWPIKRWVFAIFTVVLIQYAAGVFTLVFHVPVWLGVLHQAIAFILFGFVTGFLHFLHRIENASHRMASG